MAISTVRIFGKYDNFIQTLHKSILVANISHRKWWASSTMDSVRSTQMEMPNWLLAKKIDVQSWWFECSCSKSSLRWSFFSMEFGDHWNQIRPKNSMKTSSSYRLGWIKGAQHAEVLLQRPCSEIHWLYVPKIWTSYAGQSLEMSGWLDSKKKIQGPV